MSEDPAFLAMAAFANERQLMLLLDPQLQNSYSYARGNPISMSDASGESPLDTIAGFFMGTAKGTWGTIADLAHTVTHPIAAFGSIMSSIRAIAANPIVTAEFLTQYLGEESYNYIFTSTDYERGMLLGTVFAGLAGPGKKGYLDDLGRMAIRAGQLEHISSIASKIGKGHAWFDHVLKGQFGGEGGMFKNQKDFSSYIENVIQNPSEMKQLERGRWAYWDANTDGVVIYNPHDADGGTFFQPDDGKDYFNQLK